MRRLSIPTLWLSLLVLGCTEAAAQQPGYQHTYLLDWPPALHERAGETDADTHYPYDLLPFIDSLALGYAYAVDDGRPRLEFRLAWTPGAYGVLDNHIVPFGRLPGDVRIVAVDLRAGVFINDERVADLRIALDSLMLAPAPEEYAFAGADMSWASIFVNTPADDARAYFAAGFSLGNLEIDRIAFASFAPDTPEAEREPGAAYPPYPPHVGTYPPNVVIWVDWIFRTGAGKRGADTARRTPREGIGRTVPSEAERPRTRGGKEGTPDEDEEARTGRTRTGDRDEAAEGRKADKQKPRAGKSDDKKDDEDDDEELLPAALAGVAAVGLVAYAGGTVGYYGNTEAPLGLTSGLVRPKGGALLQLAVNEAVLGGAGREKLFGKVMIFYDLFRSPIQPSVGLGVLVGALGDTDDVEPSLSFGLAGNYGRFVPFVGYDVATLSVDFGLAFNFRYRR